MGDETHPDRYIITGIIRDGLKDAGEKVWLYWSPEGGGWWQWGPEGWAKRFAGDHGAEFEDALKCAKGETWLRDTVGPWYNKPEISTIKVERVPAIVEVVVR